MPLPSDGRMVGITGATPLVSNGKTTAFKYSDDSDATLTQKLNEQNAAARPSGSVFMPPGKGR